MLGFLKVLHAMKIIIFSGTPKIMLDYLDSFRIWMKITYVMWKVDIRIKTKSLIFWIF